jgi:hypothetical protein
MKNILILIVLTSFFFSCKQKEDTKKIAEKEWSTAEKIANAHGFENWKDVSELQFTFNVERDTAHFERSWIWKPKTDDVIMISGTDTIAYNRKSVDSTSMNADKSFINDKYWLLAPFQLVWDKGTQISETIVEAAPISNKEINKISLTYPSDGGYTPGDAYDFYYDDNYMISEWIYRKGNSTEPSMTTTWEDYEDFDGIKIGKAHNRPDANWKLHFTNIKVIK